MEYIMKKVVIGLLVIATLVITACSKNNDAKKFKSEYEKVNGEKTSYSDSNYRTLKIGSDNPFIYITSKQLIKKINNKEDFYVYFGSKYCPWCRSVIEASIEVAKEAGIKKIYYIDIWNGFHEEILRDTYKLNDENKPELVKEGTKDYKKLLKSFDNVLSSYILTTEDGIKVEVGEKRIFAPTFIYVKSGKAKKMTTAISKKQQSPDQKLSKDILKDVKNSFQEFFTK